MCTPIRTFSDESGPGTFHSLGILPKRKHAPIFHIQHDINENDNSQVSFRLSTSPPSSPALSPPTLPQAHPQLSKDPTSPVLLSNGKPLKSSLKSSPFSLTIKIPPDARHLHRRARSEPATSAKNVHFPEKDHDLATVRVFSCSASPAALSSPSGDEPEADGEDTPSVAFIYAPTPSVLQYEIDPTKSSPIPRKICSPPNVILEPLHLSPSSSSATAKLSLIGSILVSNLAFEKSVSIRFTLDDWQTVSEVGAHYADSPSLLPSYVLPSSSTSTLNLPRAKGWDRFTFTIRLDDYLHSLGTRTLWLASRYRINSTYPEPGSTEYGQGGEWWDNNCGSNYRVAFRPAVIAPTFPRGRPRRETVSEPFFPTRTQPQLPVIYKEHVSVHAVPSVSDRAALNETGGGSIPLRAKNLCLSNYAPPSMAATSSIPSPSMHSPRHLATSSITNSNSLALATSQSPSNSDEDTASPGSSAVPTPTSSPTMAPQVIINGHPATSFQPYRLHEDDDVVLSFKPGHIADWDQSISFDKLRNAVKGSPCLSADADPAPSLGSPERQRSEDATLSESKPPASSSASNQFLYDAFVTHWCFARGPEPSRGSWHHARPLLADTPFV